MKFNSIIKNKNTIEEYYHKEYNLEYLNEEDINYLTNIRNNMYLLYKKKKNNIKIELINDDFLKKFLMRIWREETMIGEFDNHLDLKYIEIIDLIILKEIQYEQNYDLKIKEERHLKKKKDMEIISDRILGNIDNNIKLDKEDFLKDIDKLGNI